MAGEEIASGGNQNVDASSIELDSEVAPVQQCDCRASSKLPHHRTTAIDILNSLPCLNGMQLRVPHYYVVNSVTNAQQLVTPNVRAIAEILARRMMSSNIVLSVSTFLLFVSYA